ncbi:glycosyl hydrolase family 28-related protein [Bradyrhizobium sp. STM 3557]|uniref:glycosyl hydrolase family 28-related protein n=1 Tax=Bradyrhizobium sp. STM 3557 TaxID=578920 RepID=UPI00388DD420
MLLLVLAPALVAAQQFPTTMPANSVFGRLGIGAGPGQPVPITSLLSAAQQGAANTVLAGPTSGGAGAMSPRSLIFSDLPQMGGGTLMGNPGSGTAAPQAFAIQNLPNLSAPNATLDFLPIYDHATGQIKYSSPSQLPGVGSPLAQNNVWSGTNDFQGVTRFGGQPWFDVKSAAQGCPAAVGDGVTDDTSAIQCHINYLNSTYAGGTVFVSPGTYLVSGGGLHISGGIWLVGPSIDSAAIKVASDSHVLNFYTGTGGSINTCPSGGLNGGIDRLSIYGYQNAAATQAAIIVGNNCLANIYNSRVWFGSYGLQTTGTDGLCFNSFIAGYTGNVLSNGANWYLRCKFDSVNPGVIPATYGFIQGANATGLTTAENYFVQCDFSVQGATYAFYYDDATNNGYLKMENSIFDSQVLINHVHAAMMIGNTFGAAVQHNAGSMSVVGSTGTFSLTISGAGGRACAANISITC